MQHRFAAIGLTDVVKAVTRSLLERISQRREEKGVHVVRISTMNFLKPEASRLGGRLS